MKTRALILGLTMIGVGMCYTGVDAQNTEPMQKKQMVKKARMQKSEVAKKAFAANFTEEQKDQLKANRLKFAEKNLALRNQLGEQKAKLNTMVHQKNKNWADIDKALDQIGATEFEVAKLRNEQKQALRSILTDEQRIHFDTKGTQQRHSAHKPQFRKRGQGKQMAHRGNSNAKGKAQFGKKQGAPMAMQQGRQQRMHAGQSKVQGQQPAQNRMRQGQDGQGRMQRGNAQAQGAARPQLNDELKTQLKNEMTSYRETTMAARLELNELNAKLKTLSTAKKVDNKAIESVLKNISDKKTSLMKTTLKHKAKVAEILPDNARMLMRHQMGRRG